MQPREAIPGQTKLSTNMLENTPWKLTTQAKNSKKQKTKSPGDILSCLWPCPLITSYSQTAKLSAAGIFPRKAFIGRYKLQKPEGLCSHELGSLVCEVQGSLKWDLVPRQPERLVDLCKKEAVLERWNLAQQMSLVALTWARAMLPPAANSVTDDHPCRLD